MHYFAIFTKSLGQAWPDEVFFPDADGPPQLSKRDLAKHDKKQKRKEGAAENRNAAMAEDETSKARVDLSFGLDQGKDCAVWNEDEATLNREILWLNHVKDGQWLINLVCFKD